MIPGILLIVDDNEDVLSTLELLLSGEFGEIKTASNPNRILTILGVVRVDAVLLDMNFSAGINSGNEGLYWLKRIRELQPELPVIMLTAYGNVELAVTALKNGATDFILNPGITGNSSTHCLPPATITNRRNTLCRKRARK